MLSIIQLCFIFCQCYHLLQKTPKWTKICICVLFYAPLIISAVKVGFAELKVPLQKAT